MYVPTARPIAVHAASAIPHQYAKPGNPIKSQPLMSLASALIAAIQGPSERPPKKYSFELCFDLLAKYKPIPITISIYAIIDINI